MSQVVLPDQLGHEYVFGRLPRVVRFGVALPFHQILQFTRAPRSSMTSDGLDFKLLFPLHEVRGQFRKVDPVLIGLLIRSQQGGVKHVMNGPGCGQLESIGDRRDSFHDREWAMTSGGQFVRLIRKGQVLGLQPDLISHAILIDGCFSGEAVQGGLRLFLLLKRRFLTEISRRVQGGWGRAIVQWGFVP